MSTTVATPLHPPTVVPFATVADLLHALGDIPPERVRLHPAPGAATVEDLLSLEGDGKLVELVDGVFVEKAMGFRESRLATVLIFFIETYLRETGLGVTTGAYGAVRLTEGLVRIPDVAYFAWSSFPNRKIPKTPIPNLVPDLAVEILSPSNTELEMARKRRDYFAAGVRVVWLADPDERSVRIYRPDRSDEVIARDGALTCEDVLPGFSLSVAAWFEKAGID